MKRFFVMTIVAAFCFLALAMPAAAQVDLINEDFEGVTIPALPTGWTVENTNGDSNEWVSYGSYPCSGSQHVSVHWNGAEAMDDWLFTPVLALDSTHNYTLAFNYRAASSSFPEDLTVFIGSAATSASQTTQLVDVPGIVNTTCSASSTAFTVPTTGAYYIGFHGHSAADEFYLIVDDIVVTDETVPVELLTFSIE